MRFRWRKYLPSYPAILLVPLVLAVWVMIWTIPYEKDRGDIRGFPFDFSGSWEEYDMSLQHFAKMREAFPQEYSQYSEENLPTLRRPVYGFRITWFLIDLIIALAAAYVVAMALDRLVFPWIRRWLGQERAAPPEPS